jgi:hypothetical protein
VGGLRRAPEGGYPPGSEQEALLRGGGGAVGVGRLEVGLGVGEVQVVGGVGGVGGLVGD